MAENSGVQITVGTSGTGGGFEKFCAGETDISDASRPIKADDEAEGSPARRTASSTRSSRSRTTGSRSSSTRTTTGPSASPSSSSRRSGSRTPKHGHELEPGRPDVPRRGARAVRRRAPTRARSTTSPTRSTVRRARAAPTTAPTEDDNVTVQGVAGSKGGLGYFGLSYYEENTDKLKVVEVDGGDGCVEPTTETVQDGTYTPLSRPLFIYPTRRAARTARGRGVRRVLHRQRDVDRREGAVRAADRRAAAGGDRRGRTIAQGRRRRRPAARALQRRYVRHDHNVRRRGRLRPGEIQAGGDTSALWREGRSSALLFAVRAASRSSRRSGSCVVAHPADDRVLPRGRLGEFFTGTEWSPLFSNPQFGVLPLVAGTLVMTLCASLVVHPVRARLGDLPQRVRAAATRRGPEADARGARRHPDRRLRLLRAEVHQPDRPGPLAVRRHARGLQRARRPGSSWAS